jgi:hypothetical protein
MQTRKSKKKKERPSERSIAEQQTHATAARSLEQDLANRDDNGAIPQVLSFGPRMQQRGRGSSTNAYMQEEGREKSTRGVI